MNGVSFQTSNFLCVSALTSLSPSPTPSCVCVCVCVCMSAIHLQKSKATEKHKKCIKPFYFYSTQNLSVFKRLQSRNFERVSFFVSSKLLKCCVLTSTYLTLSGKKRVCNKVQIICPLSVKDRI